jgi:cytidylate kinase
MRTILLDGESKTGKTSVGDAIVDGLTSRGLQVYSADAGAFFRKLTAAIFGRLGLDSETVPDIDSHDLEATLVKVVRDGDAHDGDWGDLEAPGIGRYVSVVGSYNEAVRAGDDWYVMTAQRALRAKPDALVLNGRNPGDRLAGHDIGELSMGLLVQCDPWVAGIRVLRREGICAPTENQIQRAADQVMQRRLSDRSRETHPYQDPVYAVPYELGRTAPAAAIAASRRYNADDPFPIRVETTNMPLGPMRAGMQELACTAMGLVR